MELVRRAIRSVISYDSKVYRTASNVLNHAAIARREGPMMAKKLARLAQADAGPPEPVAFKSLAHPLYLRPGTPDAGTAITNIIREDHGQVLPPKEPVFMIDAGAYIGDSATYFLSKYPDLKVVALEPDPENYEMAKKNLEPYGDRVYLYNQALSAKPGTVFISGEYEGAGISDSGVEIEATTIPAIMKLMGWDSLSMIKMDIEGEEINVLGKGADDWLQELDFLIVEIHGPHIEAVVKATLLKNGFSMKRHRTSWYCLNGQG